MSDLTNKWLKAFGRAKPSAPNGLVIPPSTAEALWADVFKKIGAGYFRDRFLYLFGEGLDELTACLDAWSFVVPKSKNRVILGRNAYGAILFVDNAQTQLGHVYVVDPTAPSLYGNPDLNFLSLLGTWLPDGKLDYFVDDSVYVEWRKQAKKTLGPKEVLAMKTPRELGGKMKLDNFNVEDILPYYETTAPIYAKALGKKKRATK